MLTIQRSNGSGRYVALSFICLAVLGAAGYVGINAISPASSMTLLTGKPQGSTLQKLAVAPRLSDDRLYLPKINVDLAIGHGVTDAHIVNTGALTPNAGGSFTLSAAQFQWGSTPRATAERSPFYHLSELTAGDQLVVDYSGQRYGYVVTNDVSDDTNFLTLYATSNSDQKVGSVIKAKPVTNLVYRQN